MYLIEITDISGGEVWWGGKGWYWMDTSLRMRGPYLTEYGALYDYAWHVKGVIDEINERGEVQ